MVPKKPRVKHRKAVRKEETINIRVTAAQKAELVRAADYAGVTVSSWMLQASLEKARRG